MRLIKRMRVIAHLSKYGGQLTFEDTDTLEKVHFNITKKDFKLIHKMLRNGKKYYLLMNNLHHLKLYKNLEDIASYLDQATVEVGKLYFLETVYTVLNRELMMQTIDKITLTYQDDPFENTQAPKITKTRSKRTPTKRFDWHDHYLEGMRMHGNVGDAEPHADEMEKRYKQNNN